MMAKPIKNLQVHYFLSNDLAFDNKYRLFVKAAAIVITLVLKWKWNPVQTQTQTFSEFVNSLCPCPRAWTCVSVS